jgi:hypothetical protein
MNLRRARGERGGCQPATASPVLFAIVKLHQFLHPPTAGHGYPERKQEGPPQYHLCQVMHSVDAREPLWFDDRPGRVSGLSSALLNYSLFLLSLFGR